MLIIDCHAHVTSFDEQRYRPKPNPFRPPKGVGSSEHLRQTSLAAGVSYVRAIQTLSFYGFDNQYLLDSARQFKPWMAGVCTLDPDNPRSPDLLRQYAREYGVRSLRSIPSAQTKNFDHDGVRALWKAVADSGLTVDIFLMRPEHIPTAEKLIESFPGLTVGFCHCMDLKPGPDLKANTEKVRSLARHKNLYAKVDFVGTGSKMPFPCEDLLEAALRVIDAYGPDRCVWTSSYPNAIWTPMVTYQDHLRIFTEALPLTEAARRQILGETARKIWFPELKA